MWAFVNGNYLSGGIIPWWGGSWIYIPGSALKCGCNRIRLYVWTCWRPWFFYQLWFPPQNCHWACNSNFLTFYNRRTCKCECLNRCCPYPWQTRLNNPPSCQCVNSVQGGNGGVTWPQVACPAPVWCVAPRYWDHNQCRCRYR